MTSTSTEPPPPPVEPGFRLDRYEMLAVLAQGGMANVWLARLQGKHGFEKLVAAKTILPHFATDKTFRQMFLDEATIASRIEHPNVVQILDLGEYQGNLYIVMELVDGDPLDRLHRTCVRKDMTFPLPIGLKILSDACAGLHAAHELRGTDGTPQNVVHRDVSPQNILVTTRGISKVIDFGIAKARDRVTGATAAGQIKGKIDFMAREQATGAAVDRRADTWAVGACLYWLITGLGPYEQEDPVNTLARLLSAGPIAPLPKGTPAPIVALVNKALEHDVKLRFQTALEMQDAIDRAAHDAGLVASTGQVGAFMAEHLKARAQKRKETIETALKDAASRAAAKAALAPPPTPVFEPIGLATKPDQSSAPSTVQAVTATARAETEVKPAQSPRGRAAPLLVTAVAAIVLIGVATTSLFVFTHKIKADDRAGGPRELAPMPSAEVLMRGPAASASASETETTAAPAIADAASPLATAVVSATSVAAKPATSPTTPRGSKPTAQPSARPEGPAARTPQKDEYGF
jgi:serine/threonine-protein kinase